MNEKDHNYHIKIQTKIWDNSAISTDDVYRQVHYLEFVDYKSIANEIFTYLDIKQEDNEARLLEIGCGNCLLLEQLHKRIKNVYGIDLSSNLVNRCREIGINNIVVDEAVNIDKYYEANFFDYIICNSVFQYFPSESYAYEVVKKMIKLTKSGGKIYIGDIYNKRLQAFYEKYNENLFQRSKKFIKKFLKKFGYRTYEFRYLYLYPEFFINNFSKDTLVIPKLIVSDKPELFKKFRYDVIMIVK